jgi:hypothetical protein
MQDPEDDAMIGTQQTEAAHRDSTLRVDTASRPVWMAALLSADCRAVSAGREQAISWEWMSGRAVYSNTSSETELILPLGVRLLNGHTIALYWAPAETTYTVEIYPARYLRVA